MSNKILFGAVLLSMSVVMTTPTLVNAKSKNQCGSASWYALTSRTASGERMNPDLMTAAHRYLRFGTKVRVTNKRNGKSVIVRINDRGPFTKGRIIDLSRIAARKLGFIRAGHTSVCLTSLG
ncbi:MAG: septal ring lytic transglycosylase RlpA family lipoprotein [Hyphomicrobiales bacterium]|nr:MAG: septal ring lytic transglycosylase RlpA family lipoprotein [Hyphomicrobiales bacterium]